MPMFALHIFLLGETALAGLLSLGWDRTIPLEGWSGEMVFAGRCGCGCEWRLLEVTSGDPPKAAVVLLAGGNGVLALQPPQARSALIYS